MKTLDFKILSTAKRLLIYGGSFDPPHMGHVNLSEQARAAIDADYLLVIPAGRQPLKDPYVTISEDRIEMLMRAFSENDRAMMVDYEINRNQDTSTSRPTYTFDTLMWLNEQLPDQELRLLLGADQLGTFDRWFQYEKVIETAQPLVMTRGGDDPDILLNQLPETDSKWLTPERWKDWMICLPLLEISSTEIRTAIAEGAFESISDWLHPDVLRYIRKKKLYRALN